MNDKRIPITDEYVRYRKKSTSKGQPRADHKHKYEVVLLNYGWQRLNVKTGAYETETSALPYRVCTICRRTNQPVWNKEYFIKSPQSHLLIYGDKNNLSPEALALPKWEADDYFSKIARKIKTNEEN